MQQPTHFFMTAGKDNLLRLKSKVERARVMTKIVIKTNLNKCLLNLETYLKKKLKNKETCI